MTGGKEILHKMKVSFSFIYFYFTHFLFPIIDFSSTRFCGFNPNDYVLDAYTEFRFASSIHILIIGLHISEGLYIAMLYLIGIIDPVFKRMAIVAQF